MASYRLGDDGVLTVVEDGPDRGGGGPGRGGGGRRPRREARLRRWSRLALRAGAAAAAALAALTLLASLAPSEGGGSGTWAQGAQAPAAMDAARALGGTAAHGAEVVGAAARRVAGNLAANAAGLARGEGV